MTDKQYEKRIQFLKHIQENYVALKGFQLIFYFEDYEISTIRSEYRTTDQTFFEYQAKRHNLESGSVILGHGFSGEHYLALCDKFLSIIYDITNKKTIIYYQKVEFDLEILKTEMHDFVLSLKSK
jgi:hypothetical protein